MTKTEQEKERQTSLIDKIRHTLQWIDDLERGGEMIQSQGYNQHYLSFDGPVLDRDLETICKAVNALLTQLNHRRRIGYNMGEIIPCIVK